MEKTILNYRVVVKPDKRTGTGKACFSAYAPSLGVAADGDTIEETIENVKAAIKAYILSLIQDGEEVPVEDVEKDIITTASIQLPQAIKAF